MSLSLDEQNHKSQNKKSGSKISIGMPFCSGNCQGSFPLSFLDCVLQEMRDYNPELKDFFKLIKKEYLADIEKIQLELLQKIEESKKDFSQLKAEKLRKERGNGFYYSIYYVNNKKKINLYVGDELFHIDDSITYESMLEEVNISIPNLKKGLEELYPKLSKLYENVAEAQKKYKVHIFSRDYYFNELCKEKCKLSIVQEEYNLIKYRLEEAERKRRMLESSKEFFIQILSDIKTISIYQEQESKMKDELRRINDLLLKGLDESVLLETFNRLLQEGKITKEKIVKIFYMLDKVEIKARRGRYAPCCFDENNTKNLIVEWFLEKVYEADIQFVENNNYLNNEETEDGPTLTKKNN